MNRIRSDYTSFKIVMSTMYTYLSTIILYNTNDEINGDIDVDMNTGNDIIDDYFMFECRMCSLMVKHVIKNYKIVGSTPIIFNSKR